MFHSSSKACKRTRVIANLWLFMLACNRASNQTRTSVLTYVLKCRIGPLLSLSMWARTLLHERSGCGTPCWSCCDSAACLSDVFELV